MRFVSRYARFLSVAILLAGGAARAADPLVYIGTSGGDDFVIDDDEIAGSGPCDGRGAPGWGGQVVAGGGNLPTASATARECCLACVANQDCTQWVFDLQPSSGCALNIPPGNTCAGTPVPIPDSGQIRCLALP